MKTILVVDDDGGVRALLRRVIEGLGHRVLDAASALDALEVLEMEPVDLALCDVMMPEHDGIWLMEQVLSRHAGTPIALATGLMEMDPAITLRPGVVGYIVKPFRHADVVGLLRQAFESPAPVSSVPVDLASLDAF